MISLTNFSLAARSPFRTSRPWNVFSISFIWLIHALPERRYRIVRREILADGFMQQHVLEGVLADGQPFAMPACVVVQAKDGRITRLDEYLDPAAGAPLAAQPRRAKTVSAAL